jgi:hypothetical protein
MVLIVDLTSGDDVLGGVQVVIYRRREQVIVSINNSSVCVARLAVPIDQADRRVSGDIAGQWKRWPRRDRQS